MHSLLSMLESEYNSLKSVLATTSEGKTPKGTSNTETPAYKMFLSILLSQEHIIGWIRDQHATEDKFANETAIFIKNQKDTCNYEHGILADFKRNFQRIPIQYQM
ncbi:MAG: hypothetical protein JNJ47_04725 [Alphaproteobacteria bacterium]|nr:hypothetical protein [Alphaproteobacteria bacterium]